MVKIQQTDFVETNPLLPVGPAEQLFISGVSVFEITDFEPPLQRVTVAGINLPNPGLFGPYDSYLASLVVPGDGEDTIEEFFLNPTIDGMIWAASTFLDFGGTLFPINATVRPVSEARTGPVILEGPVLSVDNGNGDGNGDGEV